MGEQATVRRKQALKTWGQGGLAFPPESPWFFIHMSGLLALSHSTVNTQVCKGPPPTLALKVPARK